MTEQEILNALKDLPDADTYGGPLNELRTREYETFFNHLFSVIPESEGFTTLWFDEDTSANGAINRDGPDVVLHCDAQTNEHAQLETTERTNYPPGTTGAIGWTFQPEGRPSGDQDLWAGATDGGDGVGIGLFEFNADQGTPQVSSPGVQPYIFYERTDQTRLRIPQEHWNQDTMDGSDDASNPSGFDINDFLDGVICRIDPQLFYGHGLYSIQLVPKRGENGVDLSGTGGTLLLEDVDAGMQAAHNIVVSGATMVDQPNVPLRARTETNSVASALDLHWTAVHYERARTIANIRLNGIRRSGVDVDTSWEPLISWQKRSGWEQVNSRPITVVVASDTDLEIELQLGTDLNDDASFGLPPHTSSSEAALDYDNSATGFASGGTGERRWVGQVSAGQGSSRGVGTGDLDFNLPANRVATLAARADSANATVDAVALTGSEF